MSAGNIQTYEEFEDYILGQIPNTDHAEVGTALQNEKPAGFDSLSPQERKVLADKIVGVVGVTPDAPAGMLVSPEKQYQKGTAVERVLAETARQLRFRMPGENILSDSTTSTSAAATDSVPAPISTSEAPDYQI